MSVGRLAPLRALATDPRFSWCAYLPAVAARRAAVLIHGSDRDPVAMVRAFADWADARGVGLVAPLFPGGVPGPENMDGYKQALEPNFSFVAILDDVLADVRRRHGFPAGPFDLFGFSGGAQFAHRYALVSPRTVNALAIVAPGNVTLLRPGRRWWAGVDDVSSLSGASIDGAGMSALPVLAMVGSEDDGRTAIKVEADEARWVPGANDAGQTRVERLQALVSDWQSAGIRVQHHVLPGVSHDFLPFVSDAQAFFDAHDTSSSERSR